MSVRPASCGRAEHEKRRPAHELSWGVNSSPRVIKAKGGNDEGNVQDT